MDQGQYGAPVLRTVPPNTGVFLVMTMGKK